MSSPALQPRSRTPRLAEAAVTRARLTVVPRVRSRAPRVPFVLLVSGMLVAGVVGLLLFNTSMQQGSFTTAELQRQATALNAQEEALVSEVEQLRSPQRIAERAQGMGMVLPTTTCFLHLSGAQAPCLAAPADRTEPLRLEPPGPVKPASLDPATIVVQASSEESGDAGGGSGDPQGGRQGAKHRHGQSGQSGDTASASPDRQPGRDRNGTTGQAGTRP